MKISTNFLICLANIAFIKHWKMAGAFVRPNGISLNCKWP
jgi:hypothetical protein